MPRSRSFPRWRAFKEDLKEYKKGCGIATALGNICDRVC